MVDRDTAMSDLDLIALKNLLDDINIPAQFLPLAPELPLSTLIITLDKDYQNRDRRLSCSFIPLPDDVFPDVKLLQHYTELSMPVPEATQGTLEALLLAINLTLPIGNFGINKSRDLYFRYVYTLPKFEMMAQRKEVLIEILKLISYALDANTELIEQVASGAKSAEQAISELGE